ncbi:MAG TPA: hypothetical protein PLE21_00440 [Giesbergeria sp.]|nr:hypothetical protein [Giesbergeria sp.]
MDDFGLGVAIGALAAALIVSSLFMSAHYRGANECEKDLPRSQQCEKKWVAPE